MTVFLLIRHGESEANREGFFAGQCDVALLDKGLKQAQATARFIAENYKADKLYSSDLKRALDTALAVKEQTGLPVRGFNSGPLGGDQQIGAMLANGELDLIIFLRDPLAPKSHEPDVNKAVKLCDTHNVPLATNLATAELLVKALDRGDLEWREMFR